jgi:single-strand DNA-binding protein
VIWTNAFLGKKGVDLKSIPNSDKMVATYSIAVPKEYSKEKEYEYINCVTWGKDGEWLANNSDRIKKVGVIGRLQTRHYENKEGKNVYITEIITEKVEVEEWNNINEQTAKETIPLSKDYTEDSSEDSIPF